jgi:uncharacterized protein YdhG (YjbR/CyaY superfamily)
MRGETEYVFRRGEVEMKTEKYGTIDEYIRTFPEDIREILTRIRQTVRESAPDAVEAISYRMPTFKLNGNLVYFAAFKHHIGFYPTPSAIVKYAKELAKYAKAKGSIQFPLDQPIPYALITKIVKSRVKENLEKAKAKARKKK